MNTPITQQTYRNSGGEFCPQCQGSSIANKPFLLREEIVSQRCACTDCNLAWTDSYRLAGYVREYGPKIDLGDWEALLNTSITEESV